jgi:hypothetical protein
LVIGQKEWSGAGDSEDACTEVKIASAAEKY